MENVFLAALVVLKYLNFSTQVSTLNIAIETWGRKSERDGERCTRNFHQNLGTQMVKFNSFLLFPVFQALNLRTLSDTLGKKKFWT